jgi:flagellin
MANSINTNVAAYSAQMNISRASNNASSSIARLSSGNRIVKASDDVAALSVGTSLRTQVTTLRTALINANQGTSMLQVADGALGQIVDILQRQKAIATQASSGSLTSTERGYLNQEFQALTSQIDQISGSTNFNGVNLLAGGLGNKFRLATSAASTTTFTPGGASLNTSAAGVASTVAVQAFDITAGTAAHGTGTSQMQLVDAAGTVLAGQAFDGANSAVRGQIEKFEITDVVYATAAKLSVTINGVVFTGTAANAATSATVSNGTTNIKLGFAATAFTLTNAATVELSKANMVDTFKNIGFLSTGQIQNVDFSGTVLEGSVGVAGNGNAMVRLADTTQVNVSNFRYLGNTGGADTSILAVDINGSTFTAVEVLDEQVAGTLVFEDGTGQALIVNTTGLDTDFGLTAPAGNLRTNLGMRQQFIDALNIGFSRAGGGVSFGVGSTAQDAISVSIKSAKSVNLYNGQTLSVATSADALNASAALDQAIKTATSIRADVGGLQSRFNFAAANVETSIQNQDAARGILLDTDVAAESTSFATSQVQVQAGISVLAQANQLTQSLLKLIG